MLFLSNINEQLSITIVTIVKGDQYIIIGTLLPVSGTNLKIHVKLKSLTLPILFGFLFHHLVICKNVMHYYSVVPEM